MYKLSWIMLVLIPIAWGTTLPMTKALQQDGIPTAVIVFIRFLITTIVMFPIAYTRMRKQNIRVVLTATVVGVFLALGYIFQFGAADHISSATIAVITSLNIIVVPLLTLFVFKTKVPKFIWIAAPFAIAGSMIMQVGGSGEVSVVGYTLAIFATLAYAIQSTIAGNANTGTSMRAFTFFMVISATLVSGTYLLTERLLDGPADYTISASSWWSIIYLALGCTFFPFFGRQLIFKHIQVSRAMLVVSTEIIFTVLFATILYGEELYSVQIIGIGLIVFAIFVSQESWKAFKVKRIPFKKKNKQNVTIS